MKYGGEKGSTQRFLICHNLKGINKKEDSRGMMKLTGPILQRTKCVPVYLN